MGLLCRLAFGGRSLGALIALVLVLNCVQAAYGQKDGIVVDPGEVVRVDTKLVDLKVSVLCSGPDATVPVLKQTDFSVAEDGKRQNIQFFNSVDAPFDLILLLDLSGSSEGKLKLIRRSAERFVNAARPTDRIAVLTFTSEITLISPLTLDREMLTKNIKSLENATGGTNFWDSLQYTLTHLPDEQRTGRRTAVVIMTDGYDNALPGQPIGIGSVTTFPQLMELVRQSSAIIVPIYLDTEKEMLKKKAHSMTAESYALAREQLKEIAISGGGKLYTARKLEDLTGVYEQVIRDLGTVYSIGYEAEREPDGSWRKVSVAVPGHPGLTVRTRPGYYARKGISEQ